MVAIQSFHEVQKSFLGVQQGHEYQMIEGRTTGKNGNAVLGVGRRITYNWSIGTGNNV
jgi:hypothetical protein